MTMLRVRSVTLSGQGVRDPRTGNLESNFNVDRGPTNAIPEVVRTECLHIWFEPETNLLWFHAAKKDRETGKWVPYEPSFCHSALASEGIAMDAPRFPAWEPGGTK